MKRPLQTILSWNDVLFLTLKKLNPVYQWKNPVMFAVYIGAIITTGALGFELFDPTSEVIGYMEAAVVLLWLTVLFANLSEALAEGRGKAQAQALRSTRSRLMAKKILGPEWNPEAPYEEVGSEHLCKGDVVLVSAGEWIPADGDVVAGAATVDESAITGESAPVVRESGGDRSSVTGGTKVLSDWLVIQIGADPGQGFLDQMIALIEGAKRQKTPNEVALGVLLVSLTVLFLVVTVTLAPMMGFVIGQTGSGSLPSLTALVILFVCLAPTTIGALLSAIGIAGINRLAQARILAISGRAVEAAGDVDVLLLDKTGTITLGNRRAVGIFPREGAERARLFQKVWESSKPDDTPEGRSIIEYLETQGFQGSTVEGSPVLFSAETRLSGWDGADPVRKGALAEVATWSGHQMPPNLVAKAQEIAKKGGTPLAIATKSEGILGIIQLMDVLKPQIKERIADLREAGIKTIMVTGDNSLTAASIAGEAGVDEVLSEVTPQKKLELIQKYQNEGHMVAMAGDGTNDAPALAQADVALAMNTGTQAAKEAANMVDLDSDPAKLLRVVEIGKQTLMTRGALTTFSVANDVAKYFVILPALFMTLAPELGVLNIMGFTSSWSAMLSALIFNTFIIPFLVPLALKGVKYRPWSSNRLLTHNVLIYGLGGVILPFVAIKAIDMALTALGWI